MFKWLTYINDLHIPNMVKNKIKLLKINKPSYPPKDEIESRNSGSELTHSILDKSIKKGQNSILNTCKIYNVKGQIIYIPEELKKIPDNKLHYCININRNRKQFCISDKSQMECIELNLDHNSYECNNTILENFRKINKGLYALDTFSVQDKSNIRQSNLKTCNKNETKTSVSTRVQKDGV